MKFNVIIDENCEESITVLLRERSEIIEKIEMIVSSESAIDKITAYSEDEIHALSLNEIECVFVENKKTYAVSSEGRRYRLRMRLYEVEEFLTPDFIRINKSAVGNLKCIKKFKSALTGAVDAVFKCGHTEYVSRRCFADIKRRLIK